ncbi:hypothetical protein ACP70R_047772 [Stipagrostis hirtigluma subsp. patula]
MEAAVVSAAHGVMASLLGKLGDLLTDKYKLLKGAKGQIMFLKAELESIYAFLKKISDTEEPDEQAKCWAKDVRELSYDIEDSVNEFLLRVERTSSSKPHGFMGFINRIMNLLTTMNIRHEIAQEFEGLTSRAKEVNERRMRYKIDDAFSKPPKDTTIDLRLSALCKDAAELVGIDGPRDKLIQLMDDDSVPAGHLKVASIVGFGGLGKTTLANQIYRKLEGQFQCCAFVSVSQKPNISKILRTALSKFGFPDNEEMLIWEWPELINALRNFLLEKRYFIVIDDIWHASAWDIIKYALPENKNSSRVITTTRIETVARACCADHPEYVYKMEPLSDQDSRRLFFKRIFGSEDACPSNLKKVSAEILKKCGGLPLAIVTTSGLLANQPNKLLEQWEYIRDSLGSNLEVSPSLEGMRQVLNLSYQHLPGYLRTCFLYLGIYPEDYTISKNDLARQWVAQGFICEAHGKVPEVVARSYFNELINRNMIQPTDTDYNGEVMSCRVHDMMLDLILHKSREHNFITVIDGTPMQCMTRHQDKIRRLSLHLDGATAVRVAGSVQVSQIRTLAWFGTGSCFTNFQPFKHLQVLRIDQASDPSLWRESIDFTGICHLFQLRYLNITVFTEHLVLPSKIGSLQQLETIQIEIRSHIPYTPERFFKFPSDIVHMSQLLHLTAPEWTRLPDGIGSMKSLRTLHNVILEMSSTDIVNGLRELTNLVDLKVMCYFHKLYSRSEDAELASGREVLHACLEKLCNLKYLDISFSSRASLWWDPLSSVHASFCNLQLLHASLRFSRVPRWIGELHNLYDLKLTVKEVLEDDIGMLAQLASLIHLDIHIAGALKDKIILCGSGFPVLKHFRVCCSRISYLTFEAGAMAKLERLELDFNALGWDRHGAVPAGIQYLSGLKQIYAHIRALGAEESDITAAETALGNAVDMHPSRPVANIEIDDGSSNIYDEEDDDGIMGVAAAAPEGQEFCA